MSDLHLAQPDGPGGYFSPHSEESMWAQLPKVLAAVRPRQVFVLGDLFHYVQRPSPEFFAFADAKWQQLIAALSAAPSVTEALALGGNHDRHIFDRRGADWQRANKERPRIRVFHGPTAPLLLELAGNSPPPGSRCFVAHDGGNNLRVSHSVPFLLGLVAANALTADDPRAMLVCGHTHTAVDRTGDDNDAPARVASIGCFTGARPSYGVLEETPEGKFTLRVEPGI